MAKKQEKLLKDANRASRIQQTLNTPGWRDIQEIIQGVYNGKMNELLDKENPEARGAINAITEIMDDISMDLKFGEQARNEYKKKYLGHSE